MRILMVNKFLYPNGGSETYIFKLGEQLKREGHEVQFFGMEHEDRIVGNRIDCYTRNMDFHTGKLQKLLYPFKILYSFEAKNKILKVLQDFQPQVVHINNFNYQLTPSILYGIRKYQKENKTRVVYTAHDCQWVCPNHMLRIPETKELCFACKGGRYINCIKNNCIHESRVKSILGGIEGYLYKMLKTYRMVDAIICPSQFVNDTLSTNPILAQKTVTLHNFIFEGKEEKSGMLASQLLNKKYVLYFGRYSEEKGVATLLEVCKRMPDVLFAFAGKGPLECQVKDNKNENIVELGFQSGNALKTLIQNALFTVFPSEGYENCPFSVMESQMYGTPVLASTLGGTTELLTEGRTGDFFEAGNAEDLCNKISILWNDDKKIEFYRQECGKIKFDGLDQYCDKILKIYADSGIKR